MNRFLSVATVCLTLSASAAMAADVSLSQETPDQWRISKLSGVRIYGPDDKTVGKITDILMTKDGRAQYVVIGVGGFLGIGEKDVAVPFDQVAFTNGPVNPPPSTMGGSTQAGATADPVDTAALPATNATTSGGAGFPTTTALGMSASDDLGAGGSVATRSTAYPDHGRINLTVDQLKSAPAFHFAR